MTSQALGLSLAFASAFVTAFSHALLKNGDDKLAMRVWSCLLCGAVALPVALWAGPLPPRLFMLIAAFGVLGGIYQVVLVRSYQLSDFSTAYPVARGMVPLAMALGGVVLLGDRLTLFKTIGIFAVTLGVAAMALGKGMSRSGWGLAILAGVTTVGYSLIGATGIREAENPLGFIAWLFIFDAPLVPLFMLARARGDTIRRLRASFSQALPMTVAGLFSYSAITYAMRLAPLGPVSAIRETSVLIRPGRCCVRTRAGFLPLPRLTLLRSVPRSLMPAPP